MHIIQLSVNNTHRAQIKAISISVGCDTIKIQLKSVKKATAAGVV